MPVLLQFRKNKDKMKKNNINKTKNYQGKAPRIQRWTVQEETSVFSFLLLKLAGQSKTSVKALFKNGQVTVNGSTAPLNKTVQPGDTVEVNYDKRKIDFRHPMLKIIWEDEYLIVIDKKPGLLSMATDKVKERTAYHLLSDYVKKSNPANRIFILHRLDRDTSGLMMFAKDRLTQNNLQENWNEAITERTYVAVVEGRPQKDTDLLLSYLTENAGLKVYVTADGSGQEAITRYKVLKSNSQYSLLELNLETGRKNQIRAQLESIGHPIAGDPKYGATTNPARRLMLHAGKLGFVHPVTGEELHFETPIPSVFHSIVKKN